MKRSEAIEIIANHIIPRHEADVKVAFDSAEQLLKKLEEVGMSPPSPYFEYTGEGWTYFSSAPLEWEPEV